MTKQQQELVPLYFKQGERVTCTDACGITWPAIVESESVTRPGWVYVREGATMVEAKWSQLSLVRAETLTRRDAQ